MLTQGRKVFLFFPDGSRERVLIEGEVVEVNAETFVARFTEPVATTVGANAFAHAEVNNKFMQQAATVQALIESDPQPLIAFARTGEPICAESRNSYRVSLAAAAITAKVNQDKRCQLLDVSATGFAIYSKSTFTPGDVVEVTVNYNGETYTGKGRIQTAKDTGNGRFRYGLHAVEGSRAQGKSDLQLGLGRISAAAQREQLRRRAGA